MKSLNYRFVLIMLMYGGFVFLIYRDEVLGSALLPLAEATAIITGSLLRWCSIAVVRDGTFLMHPDGFAYEVAYICTGTLPSVTFIVCVLAYSGSLRNKFIGILWGVPILLLMNYLRLANLFYIGVYFPDFFDFAHEILWELLQGVVFIALWLGWMQWSKTCQYHDIVKANDPLKS